MIITKLAQSTFHFSVGEDSALVDPGSYNFDLGRLTHDTLPVCKLLILTHKHADHYDLEAVRSLVKRCNPTIIACPEVHRILQSEGVTSTAFSVGDTISSGAISVSGYRADHVVNSEAVDIFGFMIEAEGRRVYHCSDTTYYKPDFGPVDVAIVPINNRGVAMGFEDARLFASNLLARIAIPVHYDSPKDAHINPNEWVAQLEGTSIVGVVLGFGMSLRI